MVKQKVKGQGDLSPLPFVLDNLLEAITDRAVSVCSSGSDLKLETSLDD
jgi:hypothetical protein